MGVPISNVTRRVVYTASGTGPYNFTFEILAAGDVAVYRDDTLLTITTDYTVTINANGTGFITLVASPTGATQIAIVGNRTIQRTTDFVTGGDFFANTVNDEMDQQTIFAQQNAEGLQRALQAPQTDPTSINMTLPRASVRANKTLAFDTNGNPTTGEVIGDNRGNWASGIAYNKRDIVKDTSNGNVYYANTSHTSTGSQPISTNADSAKWDLIVDNASAGASATAAAASASAAATSASNASTSATNAASSASTASTQASNASTSATNAANSATAAASSASTASTAATNAGNSATAAATSATNASNSASSASTSASNASTSATSAASSASTATTQATNASNSASAASTSASNASTSATNAANSATASASSATAAAASAAAAAASFDAFDDIYLGAKSSDPSVDNDGNALTVGDQYFNTSANELRVYNGSTWQAASTVGGTVTSLSVTGATTLGQNPTLSAGTANGVAYLNGSKVLTTGSALTFDGTKLTVKGGNAGQFVLDNANEQYIQQLFQRNATANTGADFLLDGSGNTFNFRNLAANMPFVWHLSASAGAPLEQMRLTSTGLGIGTSSPGVRLHVASSGSEVSRFATTGADMYLRFVNSFDTNGYIGYQNAAMTFWTANTERARIDSSGNFGIGTSSPTSRLHVNGVTRISGVSAGSTALFIPAGDIVGDVSSGSMAIGNLGDSSSETRISTRGFTTFRTGATDGTNGSERARIDSSGRLMVGTTSNPASDRLVVDFAIGINSAAGVEPQINFNSSNASIEFVNRNSGGSKTFKWYYQASAAGSPATLSTSGVWTNASDFRGKENITDIDYGLATVSALKPRQYDVKSDGSHRVGFVAQELIEHIPEVVHISMTDKEGSDWYGVDYGSITAVLVKAIQEQQAIITQLKARLDAANL